MLIQKVKRSDYRRSLRYRKALAECFAREGSNLFLGSHPREEDQLRRWADYLEHQYHIKTKKFPVDLALASGPELLHKQVVQTGEASTSLSITPGSCLWRLYRAASGRTDRNDFSKCYCLRKAYEVIFTDLMKENPVESLTLFPPRPFNQCTPCRLRPQGICAEPQ